MSHRISSLALAQFRSYAHATLEIGDGPVVLVGPNGAGKTNLLEAVSLLSPGRGLRGATVTEMARRPGTLGWRIRATIGDSVVVLTGEPEGRRRVDIDGRTEPQARLGELIPMLWLTPAMDRLWIEGAEGRRKFIDRATLSFAPGHGEAAVRYERAMRERNRLLKDGPQDPGWLDALETQMADAGLALALGRVRTAVRLERAQGIAKTLFPKADIAMVGTMETALAPLAGNTAEDGGCLAAQAAAVAADFRQTLARGRRDDAAAGRALAGPHRSDLAATYAEKAMPAAQCSTGEQKALLLSLVLANARALAAAGRPPVLLLDEVAAHLDVDRRMALFAELSDVGGQSFLAGTDRDIFADVAPDATVITISDGAGGSVLVAG